MILIQQAKYDKTAHSLEYDRCAGLLDFAIVHFGKIGKTILFCSLSAARKHYRVVRRTWLVEAAFGHARAADDNVRLLVHWNAVSAAARRPVGVEVHFGA